MKPTILKGSKETRCEECHDSVRGNGARRGGSGPLGIRITLREYECRRTRPLRPKINFPQS